MQTTATLNRTDLSFGETHRVLLAPVLTDMLMSAAGVHVVGADQPNEEPSTATHPANTDTNLVLLLQETDYWDIEDEPVNHLARASEALNKQDAKAAESELRNTAFFVKTHAARAEGATKADLQADAAKLENLAGRVEQGEVKSQDKLATDAKPGANTELLADLETLVVLSRLEFLSGCADSKAAGCAELEPPPLTNFAQFTGVIQTPVSRRGWGANE